MSMVQPRQRCGRLHIGSSPTRILVRRRCQPRSAKRLQVTRCWWLTNTVIRVPTGQEGELWIGGIGVARGYRGQPELTNSRFMTLGHDGQRYYRTGDLVRQDSDGVLHYFGRNDDQIKIRGVRVNREKSKQPC